MTTTGDRGAKTSGPSLRFATAWGTWLGLGFQQVFDIGETEFCNGGFCWFEQRPGPTRLVEVP